MSNPNGGPGARPKPTALHKAQGTYRARRHGRKRADEPMPLGDLTEPPPDLTDDQQGVWRYAIANMARLERTASANYMDNVRADLVAKAGLNAGVSALRSAFANPSGSPSLDTSCLRAVQRVDTFGPLPAGYNQSSISVEYYCEYSGANH